MRKNIPVALVDAEIYFNGSNSLAGIGEVELPTLEYDTVSVEQMGMTAGLEVPLLGHYKKMDAKIKLDCIDETLLEFNNEKAILVECKSGIQKMDRGSHNPELYGIDATFKGLIKKMDGAKLKAAGKLETSIELAVTYYKFRNKW